MISAFKWKHVGWKGYDEDKPVGKIPLWCMKVKLQAWCATQLQHVPAYNIQL